MKTSCAVWFWIKNILYIPLRGLLFSEEKGRTEDLEKRGGRWVLREGGEGEGGEVTVGMYIILE